ncbi:MAG: hypothetical protein HOE11_00510 [Candidatus Diapherotrites archaeon]|jgi:hypothetical protein|nr:hypothetical protein [Candidatus Diapherotrites archaeon]MBT4597116.1 hypothetical protein [Candidatus Diapherotrites archaeon]
MSSNKEQDFKDFQISERKKTGSGLTNAPVWLMQKAGKRIWNSKQKRTWKNVDIGKKHAKHKSRQAKVIKKSGDHK